MNGYGCFFGTLGTMKKSLALLLFLVIGRLSTSVAQEFHTVVNDTVHYFLSEHETLVGLRVDSTAQVNGNTESYFHREFRFRHHETTTGCFTFDSSEFSVPVDLYGPSWMGFKSVELSDSLNVFFNYLGDSIFIRPLDALGSIWTVFQYDDGRTIRAEVVDVAIDWVAGQNQLVKTIELQHLDPEGQPTSSVWNGVQWKLSQYDGWMEIHSLYMFPQFDPIAYWGWEAEWDEMKFIEMRDSTLFSLSEAPLPVMRDMFDYSVGSHYQTHVNHSVNNGGYPEFDNHYDHWYISGRQDNADSRQYVINGSQWTVYDADLVFPNGYLPFQYYDGPQIGIMTNWGDYYFSSSKMIVGQPVQNIPTWPPDIPECDMVGWSMYQLSRLQESLPDDSTCSFDFYCPHQELIFYNHLIGYRISYGCFESGLGVYTNFAETAWCNFGYILYSAVDELEMVDMIIYPNPATSDLTIESRTPLSEVWVSDMAGRVVLPTLRLRSGYGNIDVSALPSGIYLVEAITEDGRRSVQKVVVE